MDEMGIRVISAILTVLILVAVIAVSKWKELIKERKLRQVSYNKLPTHRVSAPWVGLN